MDEVDQTHVSTVILGRSEGPTAASIARVNSPSLSGTEKVGVFLGLCATATTRLSLSESERLMMSKWPVDGGSKDPA